MTYQVIIVPNGSVGDPNRVLSLLNSHRGTALVITQSKTWSATGVTFKERTGKNEGADFSILSCITTQKPSLIVLDHCFPDNNSDLLHDIYELMSKQSFLLVNVLHTDVAVQHPNVSRLLLASRIDFPLCQTAAHIERFSKHLGFIRLYDFLEMPPTNAPVELQVKTGVKESPAKESPTKTEPTQKIEYHFYKTLLASLQSFIDMELFHGFLKELVDERNKQDPVYNPLSNLNYITHLSHNGDSETLTPAMKNNYIRKIQPEIKNLLKNAPELLEKIRGFFVE
jgi:hypothetical protein